MLNFCAAVRLLIGQAGHRCDAPQEELTKVIQ